MLRALWGLPVKSPSVRKLLEYARNGVIDLSEIEERWITLGNGKRIKIDGDGRVVAGLPERFHGVAVRDLSDLSHREREIEGIDCGDVGAAECHHCRKTFRTKDEAAAAILVANPQFSRLRDSEFGAYDLEFLRWQRSGRKGTKPRTPITDGRLDAINEHYDLKGASRVASFTEALYHAIPSSRRWEDLEERLGPLADAAGIPIELPAEALQIQAAKLSIADCEQEVDRRVAELFEEARAGHLPAVYVDAADGGGDAPF